MLSKAFLHYSYLKYLHYNGDRNHDNWYLHYNEQNKWKKVLENEVNFKSNLVKDIETFVQNFDLKTLI